MAVKGEISIKPDYVKDVTLPIADHGLFTIETESYDLFIFKLIRNIVKSRMGQRL